MLEFLYRLLDIAPASTNQSLFVVYPFRLRQPEEIAEVFDAGGEKTTPPLADIATAKIDLWAFAQIGFIGVSAFLLLCYLYYHFENAKLLPALIVVGAFAVPMSCLIFFWEANTPKNINLFMVLFMVLVAGLLGIGNSLFLFDSTRLDHTWLSASSAGIIEETGKLAAVVMLMGRKRKYPWILNGLLFGAAAGAGFAAFESAGYAFERAHTVADTIAITVARGLLAPFGHVIWTAASSAALWKAMEGKEFSGAALTNPKFLKVFFAVMCLHMLWNSPIQIFQVIAFVDAKTVMLGWLGWMIVIGLAREGYTEVKLAQGQLPKSTNRAALIVQGHGFRDVFELQKNRTTIGREAGNDIVLGDPSISRRHAQITRSGKDYILADLGSSHGTYVNGIKTVRQVLRHKDKIGLSGIELVFEYTRGNAPH